MRCARPAARERAVAAERLDLSARPKAVGRLASRIAHILQGKHRVDYAPTRDFGDTVVVVNLKYMMMAKNRLEGKRYYRHSGYPGGLKVIRAKE
jgi:large subunit ribosomal protein L13